MKYSELHSEWVYDWPQIIDDLEAGLYDREQKHEVCYAAGQWVTCACGNLCFDIPRSFRTGMPIDDELKMLGGQFYIDIDMLCWDVSASKASAARCAIGRLNAIEKRAAELLKMQVAP